MKNKSFYYSFLSFILISLSLSSCYFGDFDCVKATGPMQSENRDVDGFTTVENQISGDVFITQGADFEVKITARESILDEITTRVINGELRIGLDECIRGSSDISIFITMPTLEGVELSGSGNMWVDDNWNSNHVDLIMTGSGNIQVDGSFNAEEVYSRISGSGNIVISGTSNSLEAVLSGSGNIKALGLTAKNAQATISGSGNIETSVTDLLTAKISGSGNIKYSGNPTVNQTISGSGQVLKIN